MGYTLAMDERETGQVVVRTVPRIVEALDASGVVGVKWFLAFRGEPVIWLVTATDANKEVVAKHGFFRDRVIGLLREQGLPDYLAERVGVTVESEEAVARDFEGNWFYAMR